MKDYDVIVIGMGLAGLMAARAAAEEGKAVLLIGKGIGTAHTYTGCIDVLGYYPSGSCLSTESPFEALNRLVAEEPKHPYAFVGQQDIRAGLTSFLGLFEERGYHYFSCGKRNTITLTPSGYTRPTYLLPSTMEWGGIEDERDVLIVGFHGLKDFYGDYIAHNLNFLRREGRLPFRTRSISLSLSEISLRKTAPSSVLARMFEEGKFLDAVVELVKEKQKGEERVAFPAILGLESPGEVKGELEAKLDTAVFEIPTLPPSVPGLRLFQAFKRNLQRKGVTIIMGFSVAEALVRDGRCVQVTVTRPPIRKTYSAQKYILATGNVFGGGLKATREKVVEPLFNLTVYQPLSRECWFRERFFSDDPHPMRRFGIMVNEQMNPVDEKGKVVVSNLCGAGSILAHCDALGEKSGGGVALTTGYKSGKGEVP
jgi:glycerol-3-phosphate dehydrogenase subunit B